MTRTRVFTCSRPTEFNEQLKQLPDIKVLEQEWKSFVAKHPSWGLDGDEWEDAYLPADEEVLAEMNVPRPALALDFCAHH